jgi:hypothetical protein
MKIYPLSMQERARTGFSHKINITYADLTDTAGLTKTLKLLPDTGSCAAGFCVQRSAIRVKTFFSGGAVASMTASVGDSGSGTRFHNAHNCFTAGVSFALATTANMYTAADYVRVLFTATTGNLNVLTAGELEIYIHALQLTDMDRV